MARRRVNLSPSRSRRLAGRGDARARLQRRARLLWRLGAMTRWHTDKPVAPVPATRPILRIAPVSLLRATPAASRAMATARAFYTRKLRGWAKAQALKTGRPEERD